MHWQKPKLIMSTMMSKPLNQYEAAALLAISPELLKYCVSYTVKTDEKRKLAAVKGSDGLLYFDKEQLIDYDKYLRDVWPSTTPGQRPHLPSAFIDEIKAEAADECALCHSNSNSCEAAHIAAVHRSKCNHPHNLIWLCANHHTKFDRGFIGPKEDQNDLVKAAKTVMRERRRMSWKSAGNVTSTLAAILNIAGQTVLAHTKARAQDKQIAIQLAQSILHLLPEVLRLNNDEKLQMVLAKVRASIEAPSASGEPKTDALQMLDKVASFEKEFAYEAGLKPCPLCHGTRWHRENDCPICQGDGSVPEAFVFCSELFEPVPCKLCHGTGRRDGEDCPACSGQGDIDAYVSNSFDWSLFDKVQCKLCIGTGRHSNDDCPACGGEGKMDVRFAEITDWSSFHNVECRLCTGTGRDGWSDCPACKGEGEIEERIDQTIDWDGFKKVSCRHCLGAGRKDGEECPACGGEQKMYAIDAERIDWASFNDARCPLCLGTGLFDGNDCPECNGAGRMESWRAESVDLSKYQDRN